MISERVQRRIERLLDQAEEALETCAWEPAAEFCNAALALDPDDEDTLAFLEAATQASPGEESPLPVRYAPGAGEEPAPPGNVGPPTEGPTSFASGRYTVSKFLGEGGKKRVYLAHDTLLDREVAFASRRRRILGGGPVEAVFKGRRSRGEVAAGAD